jgi:hypothetical protein
VEAIRRDADSVEKIYPRFEVTVRGDDGTDVARIEKTLYVWRK